MKAGQGTGCPQVAHGRGWMLPGCSCEALGAHRVLVQGFGGAGGRGTFNNIEYLQGFSMLQSTQNKRPSFRRGRAAASQESPRLPPRPDRQRRRRQQPPLASRRLQLVVTGRCWLSLLKLLTGKKGILVERCRC